MHSESFRLLVATNPDLDSRLGYLPRRVAAPPDSQSLIVTRRAHSARRAWLAERGTPLLAAGRVHVDLWVRAQQAAGAGDASVRRRLSGIGSFYRYLLVHGPSTATSAPSAPSTAQTPRT